MWGCGKRKKTSNKYPSSDKGENELNVLTKQTKPEFLHKRDSYFLQGVQIFCSVGQRRQFLENLINKYVSIQASNLVTGLVLGGSQDLEKSLKDEVRLTGLSHL